MYLSIRVSGLKQLLAMVRLMEELKQDTGQLASSSLRASLSLPACRALTAASFICSALNVKRRCLLSHAAAAEAEGESFHGSIVLIMTRGFLCHKIRGMLMHLSS